MIAFVSGGARSGKSRLAELLAEAWAARTGGRLRYIASSRPGDAEMQARIALHRSRRSADWLTIEEPYAPERALAHCRPGDVALWDCLTVWLGQAMYDDACPFDEEPLAAVRQLVERCAQANVRLVIVSNDVNEDVPIDAPEVERYVRQLQAIHLELATRCELVVQAECGMPVVWKGEEHWCEA